MISRALMELVIDIHLLDVVPDAADKVAVFTLTERLRSARRVVDWSDRTGDTSKDLKIQREFIKNRATEIETAALKWWPGTGKPTNHHWSGLDLRARALKLKGIFEELYDGDYMMLSWQAHPGLAGVAGFDPDAFPAICGVALKIATQCFELILKFVIQELQLEKGDPLILKRLDFAMHVAWAPDEKHALGLRKELLGF